MQKYCLIKNSNETGGLVNVTVRATNAEIFRFYNINFDAGAFYG